MRHVLIRLGSITVGLTALIGPVRPAAAQNVEADPIQCWWRTSAGAIRVGEPFSLVLTCAVVENDTARVVVDQSKLEPSVIQLAPFEVTGGSHGADLRTDERRFFQYEYRLRLIAENLFGHDVALPETKLSYHVQSQTSQRSAIQGRDQSYVLPAQSIRVVSMVPADASDIRDTTTETFTDVDQRSFRANLLIVTGGVLFALAGLMALLGAVRLVNRFRKPAAASDRFVGDSAILGAAGRELSAVQRAREDGGWTPDLAGRALSALRLTAAYALGTKVSQSIATRASSANGQRADGGNLIVKAGWPRGKRIAVSGSTTPQAIAREIARDGLPASRAAMLESLEQALTRFTAAQYGRGAKLDDAALDESLAAGVRTVRRLKVEQLPLMRRFAWRGTAPEVETRAWSR
jgi:hypothetical protein